MVRLGVDSDSGRSLEISFAALEAAEDMTRLTTGVEDKNFARLGVGDVDVVFLVDRDALRFDHRIAAIVPAVDEFVLALGKIEDVHTGDGWIGDDHAAA